MKAAAFCYERPTDWDGALALLAKGARPAGGTQSLGPLLNFRLSQPEIVADLRHLPGYAGVSVTGDTVRIGAGTTHAAIEDGAVPGRLGAIMAAAARHIAYRAVRTRGTVGGSLVHADPAGDWVAILPTIGGFAIALGPEGERRVPLGRFVTGIFTTALAENELLRTIELSILPETARWARWKFCRKPGEFSKATVCILAVPGRPYRLTLAALDAPPMVVEDASGLLADPAAQASLVAGLQLEPWRAALALTALRRAMEQLR